MTISVAAIESALRSAWPDAHLASAPAQVTGGQWATMFRLAVAGAPDGVPCDLVLRVMPHAEMGAKEIAVQRAVAAAGVPTPPVRLTGPAGGSLGAAWAVMDFVAGAPLLAGLDGVSAVRRFPQIASRIPRQLADTMVAVHRIEPGPVIERVRDAARTVAFTVEELWVHLRAAAEMTGDPRLTAAMTALAATQPDQSAGVICHGDLHPLNVLAGSENLSIIDWTGAVVAPPAYDVALTWLLLRHPPLAAPAVLQPVIAGAARLLARRFVRRYLAASPGADVSQLEWYAGFHAARVLIDLAAWQRDGDPRAEGHPWRLVAPGATAVLARATSVAMSRSTAG